MVKIVTNIRIEEELRDKAKEVGLNFSTICSIALQEAIDKLTK